MAYETDEVPKGKNQQRSPSVLLDDRVRSVESQISSTENVCSTVHGGDQKRSHGQDSHAEGGRRIRRYSGMRAIQKCRAPLLAPLAKNIHATG